MTDSVWVDREKGQKVAWLAPVPEARKQMALKIPKMTRRRYLPPLGRTVHVGARFGYAVGAWYLRDRKKDDSTQLLSRRLRKAAEKLGPTYIKLAQIISAGEGVFPNALVQECKKCRDQVPPVEFELVRPMIEEELGSTIFTNFSKFESQPMAAASIAQVHEAELVSGETCVVKVQRPGIKKLVQKDLKVMSFIAPLLIGRIKVAALANPPVLVELFAETISEELDFRCEGQNMLDIAETLKKLERNEFAVPRPHTKLVTEKVLVMERMVGFAFEDRKSIEAAGVSTKQVIMAQLLGFLEGAFLEGVFHGDLHSGNLLVQQDGTTALLDFGITGRLSQQQRIAFLKLLMSATSNNVHGQVEALRDLGALPLDTDIQAVIDDLGLEAEPFDPTKMETEEMMKETQRLVSSLLAYGARLPKPLMLYIKNLVFVDGAIASLAPEIDMFEMVTDVANHFAAAHMQEITGQLGMKPEDWKLDLDGIKAGFWVDPKEVDSLTYAELRQRRELIRKRFTR